MNTAPFVSPSVIRLSEKQLLTLATEAEKRNMGEIADQYLQKAISASANGGYLDEMVPGTGSEIIPVIDGNHQLIKAMFASAWGPRPTPYRVSDALFQMGHYNGIRELDQATNKTFAIFKKISEFPIIEAFIRKAVYRLTRYARTGCLPNEPQFEIGLKNRKAPVSRAARRHIEQQTDFILHGGFYLNPDGSVACNARTGQPGVYDGHGRERALPFRLFLQRVFDDSFRIDWAFIRKEPGMNFQKYPVSFFAPAMSENIRRTVPERYSPVLRGPGAWVEYVETSPSGSGVIREYTWREASVLIRNPRADFWGNGYGRSETEVLVQIISMMVMGLQYQKTFIDDNHIPPGIVALKGNMLDMDEEAMGTLRMALNQYGGMASAWRLLWLFFPPGADNGVDFTALRDQMGATSSLEFLLKFMTFLITTCGAVYGILPEDMGFEGFSSRNSSPISEADPTAQLQQSRDDATVPALEAMAELLTTDFIEPYDPDFEFRFLNMTVRNPDAEDKHRAAMLAFGLSMNEYNDLMDKDRIDKASIPWMFNEVLRDVKEDKFDTKEEHAQEVRKVYEKKFRDLVPDETLSPWSITPDLPGNPALQGTFLQEYQAAIGAAQQAIQQASMKDWLKKQGYPEDLDPEKVAQMQQMGLMPNFGAMQGDPNQQGQPGAGAMGGQPTQPGGPQPGAQPGGQPGAQQGGQAGAPQPLFQANTPGPGGQRPAPDTPGAQRGRPRPDDAGMRLKPGNQLGSGDADKDDESDTRRKKLEQFRRDQQQRRGPVPLGKAYMESKRTPEELVEDRQLRALTTTGKRLRRLQKAAGPNPLRLGIHRPKPDGRTISQVLREI